ncbi:MAG: type II secretion system protein [Candidatus Woesebacteria bacterium]|nr:MAG: type II secretion system protein [Candidatus Woesebacteria bacterium]
MNKNKGFTLIELLVAIAVMGILLSLSLFALNSARISARDTRRKSDIEVVRSGIELYRADCNVYPSSPLPAAGSSLVGSNSPSNCPSSNVYISKMPGDPQSPNKSYFYSTTGTTYMICSALEQAPNPAMDVSGCGSCGSTGACNYKVTGP